MQKQFFVDNIILNKNKKIEISFVKFAAFFGLIFIFLMPIMQIQDEDTHIMRSINIGYLNFFNYKEGFDIFESIYQFNDLYTESHDIYVFENNPEYRIKWNQFIQAVSVPLNDSNRVFFLDGDENGLRTKVYGNLCYIPQGLGILIGRLFNFPVYWTLITGRIFKLLFYISFIFFALKICPIGKEIVFIIALLPNSIQYAASFSPDGILYCTSLFYLSYILYLKSKNENLGKKNWVIIIITLLFIFSVKYIYAIQFLFIFTIPLKKLFPSLQLKFKINKKVVFLSLFAVLIILYLFACYINTTFRNCTHHPLNFLISIYFTIKQNPYFYFSTLTANFGTGYKPMPYLFTIIIFELLLLSPFFKVESTPSLYCLKKWDVTLFSLYVLSTTILIFMTGILWGNGDISAGPILCFGILGRYFIALLFPFLLSLKLFHYRIYIKQYFLNICVFCYMTYSCYYIINNYWL